MLLRIVFLVSCVLCRHAYSEELSAFAGTTPDMSITNLFRLQLKWQKKYRTRYKPKDCARGKAVSWFTLKSKRYLKRYFNITSISSVEAIKFSNKTNIVIVNVGCEYFSVFIRYEFPSRKHEFDLIEDPYLRAIAALQKISQYGKNNEFRINKVISQVRNLIDKKNIPNLGEWTLISGDGSGELQAQFTLLKMGVQKRKLQKKSRTGFIEFALGRGPL